MNSTRILTILSAFLLLVCLVFSVTALTVLRNATEESKQLQSQTETVLSDMNVCVSALKETYEDSKEVIANEDVETDVLCEDFTVKTVDNKVGVYSSKGTLIAILNINPEKLPKTDRQKLNQGIHFQSWKELSELLEDYS